MPVIEIILTLITIVLLGKLIWFVKIPIIVMLCIIVLCRWVKRFTKGSGVSKETGDTQGVKD